MVSWSGVLATHFPEMEADLRHHDGTSPRCVPADEREVWTR